MPIYNVLMIIEDDIATTHLVERVLLAGQPDGVIYRKKRLSQLSLDDFDINTIPLFVRCGDPSCRYWIDLLRRARHPYLYYIDDNFWRIPGQSALAMYYQHPYVRRALEDAVNNADRVLTNSIELAKFLFRYNQRIDILPTFFDFSLIEGCVRCPTEEVRIGFAGSTSRINDLDIIAPLIEPILNKVPNAVFEFAGTMPKGIQESQRIRFFPHIANYAEFIQFQASRNWHIGLAPLIDNEANRCKTDNKYREYGACKIAGIYADIPPYQNSVEPGITGLMVEGTTTAWLEAILGLIADRSTRTEMAERAYEDVLAKYSVENVSNKWSDCFAELDKRLREQQPAPIKNVARRINFRLRLKVDTMRMQVESAYNSGGVQLVLKKLTNRLCKAFY